MYIQIYAMYRTCIYKLYIYMQRYLLPPEEKHNCSAAEVFATPKQNTTAVLRTPLKKKTNKRKTCLQVLRNDLLLRKKPPALQTYVAE